MFFQWTSLWNFCGQVEKIYTKTNVGVEKKKGKRGKSVKKMGYPPELSTMGITLSTIGAKALIFFCDCVIMNVL